MYLKIISTLLSQEFPLSYSPSRCFMLKITRDLTKNYSKQQLTEDQLEPEISARSVGKYDSVPPCWKGRSCFPNMSQNTNSFTCSKNPSNPSSSMKQNCKLFNLPYSTIPALSPRHLIWPLFWPFAYVSLNCYWSSYSVGLNPLKAVSKFYTSSVCLIPKGNVLPKTSDRKLYPFKNVLCDLFIIQVIHLAETESCPEKFVFSLLRSTVL